MKLAIQLRDTARFFRNAVGAGVADAILTLGATGLNAGENLPDYFIAILRHASNVRRSPERWLPWRYKDRVAELERAAAPPGTEPLIAPSLS